MIKLLFRANQAMKVFGLLEEESFCWPFLDHDSITWSKSDQDKDKICGQAPL